VIPRCGTCGYFRDVHDASGKCPLCACGRLPTEHLAVAVAPAPEIIAWTPGGEPLTWDGKQLAVCPGKPRTAAGLLPTLRRGQFAPPRPAQPAEAVPEPDTRPLVPARFTIALSEIAPGAMRLGAKAADAGWSVDPWYWVAWDGTETSALVLRRDSLRAFAQWDRSPDATWRTAGCTAWAPGNFPRKIGVKLLTEWLAWNPGDD